MKYYQEEVSKHFGYLVLDLHPSTPISKRIVRNFEPSLVAKTNKTQTEQLVEMRTIAKNPYAHEMLKAKNELNELANDPTESFLNILIIL